MIEDHEKKSSKKRKRSRNENQSKKSKKNKRSKKHINDQTVSKRSIEKISIEIFDESSLSSLKIVFTSQHFRTLERDIIVVLETNMKTHERNRLKELHRQYEMERMTILN